ncbi:hypothetical protein GF324_03550 [bacterium]|nr:hypothetical protein [bacterium]
MKMTTRNRYHKTGYSYPLIAVLLLATVLSAGCCGRTVTVAVLVEIVAPSSPETGAVLRWIDQQPDLESVSFTFEEDVPEADVLWIHLPDSTSWARWSDLREELADFVRTRHDAGTPLFLTGYATLLPSIAGIESNTPAVQQQEIEKAESWFFARKRGLQSRFGHPAFDGLFGGTFLYDPGIAASTPVIGWFGEDAPKEGRVAAVEKRYITIDADSKLMVEYGDLDGDKGPILTVGAYTPMYGPNLLQYRLDRFLENCLTYLANGPKRGQAVSWWAFDDPEPLRFEPQSEPSGDSESPAWALTDSSDLQFIEHTPDEDWYSLGGRRTLIMGEEKGGISEVWVHPNRLLKDFHAGIHHHGVVYWLDEAPRTAFIRPEALHRIYRTPVGDVEEILFASKERGGGIVQYRTRSKADLVVRYSTDLRWMWPYDHRAAGDLQYGWDQKWNALYVQSGEGRFHGLVGADREPNLELTGPYRDILWKEDVPKGVPTQLNQVAHSAQYSLQPDEPLTIVFAFSNENERAVRSDYFEMMRNPLTELKGQIEHVRFIQDAYVQITSQDETFNRLWRWNLVGIDRFVTRTPGLGTALVAGFGTTERGWDGGHEISGRPGYAWYFGRDASWSAFAFNKYGDTESVREQLEFFQAYQDLNGKVFHELSTSGSVHFDASDSTPLYIILFADYVRTSGDLAFLRQSIPHLDLAMEFLESTDTNRDDLIENVNVGHGWVEGGALWGTQTSFYLAGLWAKTLEDMAYLKRLVGDEEAAAGYEKRAVRVKKTLDSEFWNKDGRFYYFGKNPDGSFNRSRTVLPAVNGSFGLLDAEKIVPVTREFATTAFSTDWGMRILSSNSPGFNERGYHSGTVWPLFTGWTSLAEYAYNRPTQGFGRIQANMGIKQHWALGYVEEVMHGASYRPSGVCPHQCWSETNIAHPVIAGMIGWQPDAPHGTARLAPSFPVHWDTVTVRNLRVGDTRVHLKLLRDANLTHYVLAADGPSVQVSFDPRLPIDQDVVSGAVVEGSGSDATESPLPGDAPWVLELNGTPITVRLGTKGGIGVVPPEVELDPGDTSHHLRIVDEVYHKGVFSVVLEGRSGATEQFRVRTFDRAVGSAVGCTLMSIEPGLQRFQVSFPTGREDYVRKEVKLVMIGMQYNHDTHGAVDQDSRFPLKP